MAKSSKRRCAGCQRLREQVEAQRVQLEALQASVASLQEQLAAARKDSSTSSKPPSSDLVKPPKPQAEPDAGSASPRPGAQPGHPRHQRLAFPPEALTGGVHAHTLEFCPDCAGPLQPAQTPPRVVQQVDVQGVPLLVEEHRGLGAFCPACQRLHYAPLPAAVEAGGLLGPGLTVLVAYLKGVCHASFSTVRKFLRDVVGLTVSRGLLAKTIAKVSAALQGPYEQLLQALPGEPVLNVDETGHKDQGQRMWTWCLRASLYTLFKIDPTRSADVLLEVLGSEFDGVLGCDCFSAYRRYQREVGVTLQFCLAHLIRDVKFLLSLPEPREVAYGTRLRDALRELFEVIHQSAKLAPAELQRQLLAKRAWVLRVGTRGVPPTPAAQRLAKRLRAYGEGYFTFLTTPGVEPTNNLAEQAIRFVVIDRHLTQGTRGETGQRWCERIWTVIATCTQQGRSIFDYLNAVVRAHFGGAEVPTLLPQED